MQNVYIMYFIIINLILEKLIIDIQFSQSRSTHKHKAGMTALMVK